MKRGVVRGESSAEAPSSDRSPQVQIIDHCSTVAVRVDVDNNLASGYELTASLQTKDAVTKILQLGP